MILQVKTTVAPREKQPSPNEMDRDKQSFSAFHLSMYCLLRKKKNQRGFIECCIVAFSLTSDWANVEKIFR